MKYLLLLLLFTTSLTAQLNTDEEAFVTLWADPTFTDSGFQVGAEIKKEMNWFYVSAGVSYYESLNPSYTDLVATIGVAGHPGIEKITLYLGQRLGALYRASDPYGLYGWIFEVTYKINEWISAGARVWIDYREDQKNEFYGDSGGYERGLITNSTLLQENGAIEIIFSLN